MLTPRKMIALSLFFALTTLSTPAVASKGALQGKAYGKALTKEAQEVTIAELIDSPEKYVDKRVRVKGVVTDVCTHKGCWILLGGDDGKTVRFKVSDGEIVFPVESKGKRADAEGIFVKQVLTKEDLIKRGKHHAKMEGKPFDPASVTGPETHYQLKGLGAVLK